MVKDSISMPAILRRLKMNWDHKVYLPESEKRIEHLRDVVAGRPIAILASGPSISELESRISELKGLDICWFGFNTFVHEKYILSKIGSQMDIYMDSCRENIPMTMPEILEFLERGYPNLFISTFCRNTFELLGDRFNLPGFINRYSQSLLFFYLASTCDVPSQENPLHFTEGNSLQMAIQIAVISGALKIVLFGADGGASSENRYYRQESYHGPVPYVAKLLQDTINHFNPVMPVSVQNTCEAYDIPVPVILNASMSSLYTPFPKCDYDTAFRVLKYV